MDRLTSKSRHLKDILTKLLTPQETTYSGQFTNYPFTGAESGWSNTQTVTIGNAISTTPTPSVPEFSWLTLLPLFASALLVAVVLGFKEARSHVNPNLS
jgi:hypothetical protein